VNSAASHSSSDERSHHVRNWQSEILVSRLTNQLMQSEIKALRAQHATIPKTGIDRFTQGAAISAAINSS